MIKKLETWAAAIGLAEQGDPQSALELLSELQAGLPRGGRRILAVAKDAPFAPGPVEYALGLSARLGCDPLFLNILSARSATTELAATHRDHFKGVFGKLAPALPSTDGRTAPKHAVLTGDFGTLLREACRRVGGVALVILQRSKAEPCVSNLHVPVYCFDPGPAAHASGGAAQESDAPRKRER
jgi:hypothetical protein